MRRKPKTNLYVNKHSVFLLQYHIVLVTKYRKEILNGKIGDYVYENIKETLKNKECNLLEINGQQDYVHLLVECPPDLSPAEIVQVIKIRSARFTRKQFSEEIEKVYMNNVFWEDGYFISTVSDNTLGNVTNYLQNQKH